jgi:hypothetical protein
MSVATGIIRGGKLVLEGEDQVLPEGRRFTVVIDEDDAGTRVDSERLRLLLEAQAEIRSGRSVSAEEMLAELDQG